MKRKEGKHSPRKHGSRNKPKSDGIRSRISSPPETSYKHPDGAPAHPARSRRSSLSARSHSASEQRGAAIGKSRGDQEGQTAQPRSGRVHAAAGSALIGIVCGVLLALVSGYLLSELLSSASAAESAAGPASPAPAGPDQPDTPGPGAGLVDEVVAVVASVIIGAMAAGVTCGASLRTIERRFERGRESRGQRRFTGSTPGRGYRGAAGECLRRAMFVTVVCVCLGVFLAAAAGTAGGWLQPGLALMVVMTFYLAFVGFLAAIGAYLGVLYVS